jgi:MFS family permease
MIARGDRVSPDEPADETGPPARGRAWATVAVLFIFYIFAMVDRQVMTMLVDPIRRELGISDVQAGLLLGLSFALFYTTVGLAMGWIVDHFSRRGLIAASVALWGLASAACGVAHSFGELFAARVLVGVGEAALGPAAYSLLADSFPRRRLALAMAVYTIGGLIGVIIAMFGGGLLVQFSADHGRVALPLLGPVSAWRLVFFLTGLPGPLLAFLAFLVPEPARGGKLAESAGDAAALMPFLKRNARLLFWLCLGFGGLNMIVNNIVAWVPTYLGRSLHLPPATIGLIIGSVLIAVALPGQLVCGWWIDRSRSRGMRDAYMRYFIVALPIALACGVAGILSGRLAPFILGMAPLYFVAMPFAGAASAAIQVVTPNEFRGRVSALFIMATTLLGLGIGPILVAALSTAIDPSGHAIGTGLAIVVAGAGAVAVAALLMATRPFRAAPQFL